MTLTPQIIAGNDALSVTLPDEGPAFLRGAALLALLAVPPTQADDVHTLNAWRAWGRVTVDLLESLDPSWSARPQPIPPLIMTMDLAAATSAVGKMRHSLDATMGATSAYWPLLAAAHPASRHCDRTTLNGAALRVILHEEERREVLARYGQKAQARFPMAARNFETRVMRDSKPIICLAWAAMEAIAFSAEVLVMSTEAEQDSYPRDVNRPGGQVRPQISFADILAQSAVQDWVIRRAVFNQMSVLPKLEPKYQRRQVLLRAA